MLDVNRNKLVVRFIDDFAVYRDRQDPSCWPAATRQEKGWSQEDYADRAGIHRTYVSDIERGMRNPTITVIEKLALPFDVQPARLLD